MKCKLPHGVLFVVGTLNTLALGTQCFSSAAE